MQVKPGFNKGFLINISIALLIPLIHWIYGGSALFGESPLNDFWKGMIILFILLLGIIGGIRELVELRFVIKGHLGWFFLTLLATACHIMLYLDAMKYFGYDVTGDLTGTTNTLLIVGSLLFTFLFLFELLFILAHETRRVEVKRKFSWSDAFLAIYAAFGSVYIWDILLGDLGFEYQNPGYFIFAELLPAILLFLMLILPFKRYDLMEDYGFSRNSNDRFYLFLSYLGIIALAILPRILEIPGV